MPTTPTNLPTSEDLAVYRKAIEASGAIDQQAALREMVKAHQGGKVDAQSADAYLVLARGETPQHWDADAAAALEAEKAAKAAAANGTPVKSKANNGNPYELPESDPTRNTKIEAMIKSGGIAMAAGFAKSAGCSPASGKKLRTA